MRIGVRGSGEEDNGRWECSRCVCGGGGRNGKKRDSEEVRDPPPHPSSASCPARPALLQAATRGQNCADQELPRRPRQEGGGCLTPNPAPKTATPAPTTPRGVP